MPQQHAPDCNPQVVDLDLPAQIPAAMARWQQLAEQDTAIHHDYDAEKVIGFPRPRWADPDLDEITNSRGGSYYRSAWVDIPSMSAVGINRDGVLQPAICSVSAKHHGNYAAPLISVKLCLAIEGRWRELGMALPIDAAAELARVLDAAVDLVGGVPEANDGGSA
ncbi:hypothetical protein [Mycobacterium marinum]|uniref:hypothetical protein n=1 Tax=Mycobacterium marinum TaxID=1781 RepID=UPI0021C3BDA1|nr:hypothetical protein [Mycobacterium marinum]